MLLALHWMSSILTGNDSMNLNVDFIFVNDNTAITNVGNLLSNGRISTLQQCLDSEVMLINTTIKEESSITIKHVKNLHSKFIVLDRTVVIYGSANFCENAWGDDTREEYLATNNYQITESFVEQFNELWSAFAD